MKKLLKQSNLPFLLLISLLVKSIIVSSPVFDSVGIVAVSALFGFKLWLDHVKKPDYNHLLNQKIDKKTDETQKKIEELSEKISSIGANVAFSQKDKKAQNNPFRW